MPLLPKKPLVLNAHDHLALYEAAVGAQADPEHWEQKLDDLNELATATAEDLRDLEPGPDSAEMREVLLELQSVVVEETRRARSELAAVRWSQRSFRAPLREATNQFFAQMFGIREGEEAQLEGDPRLFQVRSFSAYLKSDARVRLAVQGRLRPRSTEDPSRARNTGGQFKEAIVAYVREQEAPC